MEKQTLLAELCGQRIIFKSAGEANPIGRLIKRKIQNNPPVVLIKVSAKKVPRKSIGQREISKLLMQHMNFALARK